MRYPNSVRTLASAARRAGPIDHDVKVKQRHHRVIGLVALSRQVHGETFGIAERAVSQSALVSRTQDDAGCLVGLECFLPARCAYASARYQGEASSDGRFAGADAPVFGVLSPRHIHSKP